MESVGAERAREAWMGPRQRPRTDSWVARPARRKWRRKEREGEMDPGRTEEEDLAVLGDLVLGSEGVGEAGVTQSCWLGQMGGRWRHLPS